MIRRVLVGGAALLGIASVGSTPALAQAEPENVSLAYIVTVKPGAAAQFETAFKSYVEWRKQQGDPWRWNVFMAVNGDALGQYVINSGGHTWADLDAYGPKDPDPDGSRFWATAGQHAEAVVSRISEAVTALSNWPQDLSEYSLYQVTTYRLRNGFAFMNAVARFREAAQKTSWPGEYLISSVNGGPPAVNIIVPARNWAGLKPIVPTPADVLTKAYGEAEGMQVLESFANAYDQATTNTFQFRPDLSLIPPSS